MDSVQLNGFSLEIITSRGPIEKIIYKNGNYFAVPDNTKYNLRLGNTLNVRVDAHVWIGGYKLGVWRINPFSRIIISHPDAIAIKPKILRDELEDKGLVKVTFKPELFNQKIRIDENMLRGRAKKNQFYEMTGCISYTDTVTPYDQSNRNCNLSALDYSRLIYGDDHIKSSNHVDPLIEINDSLITNIYVRMVVDNDLSTYRRKYAYLREAKSSSIAPPKLELENPSRPHKCSKDSEFLLSKKYYFDNNN